MAFLELSNVRKQFPNAQSAAVEDFSLNVDKGEFVSFLGPSGCGCLRCAQRWSSLRCCPL